MLVPDSTSSSGKYNRLKIGANSSCFVVTVENLSFDLEKDDIPTHSATMLEASVCIERSMHMHNDG